MIVKYRHVLKYYTQDNNLPSNGKPIKMRRNFLNGIHKLVRFTPGIHVYYIILA